MARIVRDRASPAHRSTGRRVDRGPSSGPGPRNVKAVAMASPSTLRAQALLEFELPAAPQRVDELPSGPGVWVYRLQAPDGRSQLVTRWGAAGSSNSSSACAR